MLSNYDYVKWQIRQIVLLTRGSQFQIKKLLATLKIKLGKKIDFRTVFWSSILIDFHQVENMK